MYDAKSRWEYQDQGNSSNKKSLWMPLHIYDKWQWQAHNTCLIHRTKPNVKSIRIPLMLLNIWYLGQTWQVVTGWLWIYCNTMWPSISWIELIWIIDLDKSSTTQRSI